MRTLPNGLRLAVIEDHRLPVVQLAIWYGCGSLCERPGKTGLAHGLEHMVYRGTAALSEAGAGMLTARAGVDFNAETQYDYTHFYALVPAASIGTALRIQADRMRNLALRENDWNTERGVVLSEYDADYASPQLALEYAARRAAFAGSAYGLTPLGERADVMRSTSRDLRRYYAAWYAPNDAFVVITGDVSPAKAAELTLRAFRYLVPSKNVPIPAGPPPRTALRRIRVAVPESESSGGAVDLAFRVPGYGSQMYAELRVLQRMLGGTASILRIALGDKGTVDDYFVDADIQRRIGLFHVVVVPKPGYSFADVERAVMHAFAGAASSSVDPAAVAVAVHDLLLDEVFAGDSIEDLGNFYGFALAAENRRPDLDRAAILQTTPQSIDSLLRRCFDTPAVIAEGVAARTAAGSPVLNRTHALPDRLLDEHGAAVVEAEWLRKAETRSIAVPNVIRPVRYVLPNGLKLYIQFLGVNPTVFVSGEIDRSVVSEPAGRLGVGSIVNDLLAFGGVHYSPDELDRISEHDGVSITPGESFNLGTVSGDFGPGGLHTNFSVHAPAAKLPTILSIVADALRYPRFGNAYVASAVDEERSRLKAGTAERALSLALFPADERNVSYPTPRSLNGIRLRTVEDYARRMLRPDLATLVVTGDIDPLETRELVARYFGDWKAVGPRPRRALPLHHRVASPTCTEIPERRARERVLLGVRAPSRSSKDFYAMMLLNELLGANGGFDTRLVQRIRLERGLVYDVGSTYFPERTFGQLTIAFESAPDDAPAIATLVRDVLQSFRAGLPALSDVAFARAKLVSGTRVAQQSSQTIASMVSLSASYGLPLDYWNNLARRYAEVTPADIRRVAQQWLAPQKIVEIYERPRERGKFSVANGPSQCAT